MTQETALALRDNNGMGKPTPVMIPHQTALEPSSLAEAITLCKLAVASGLMPKGINKMEAALMVLMRGRELGLTAMQSFASINIIEGKACMSAELILARVKQRADLCKYFILIDSTDKSATFETHRVGDPKPVKFTFTWEMAAALNLTGKDNYKKQPANMLRWRCTTALSRLVYPELTIGLVDPDEAEIIREETKYVESTRAETAGRDDLEDRIESFSQRIKAATSLDDLKALIADVTADPAGELIQERLADEYQTKKTALKEGK